MVQNENGGGRTQIAQNTIFGTGNLGNNGERYQGHIPIRSVAKVGLSFPRPLLDFSNWRANCFQTTP